MSKLSYKTLLIILFSLLIAIIALWKFVLPKQKVSAAWWNDGWNYRVSVNIGNTGSSLTNFQVPINIGTSALINSGKMQSDCDDIRVVDQNGNLLTYWVSGCGTTSTKIWPKIPSIPNGGATVYVYYGNPSATSVKSTVGTSDYPGLSCKSILDAGNSTGNNTYWIDPTNGDTSNKFQAFCDMTNDSGGWMLVTQSMINSEVGVSTTVTKTVGANNGLIYTTTINGSGCNSYYSKFYLTDIIPWTKIKADYQFLGGNSCWGIFGNTNYSGGGSNLITFSSGTDTIRNQVKMGGSNGDNFDGVTSRCDNETFNFWHSNQGVGTTRSAQVILRRNSMSSLAGLAAGAACVTNGYPWKYQNIYIREDAMTFAATSTPSSEEAGGGPIAYWKFDEGIGTSALNSANNSNTGTITGATWQTEDQCISGKCLYFNGSSYVNTNFGTNRDISINPISVSMWVKPTSAGNYMFLSPNQGTNQRFYFSTYNGKWDMGIQNSGWGGSGSINVDLNKWSHIEIVTTGSVAYMYVNGKITSQKNYTSFTFPENLYIGIHGSSGAYGWVGYIDDVKIYPYARSATQIKQDYNSRGSLNGSSVNLGVQSSTAPDLNSKLISYYKFDEGSGTTTNDSSPQKKSGSLVGTTLPTWSNNCKSGKCINFTSTNANDISTNTIYNNGLEYTVSAFIYPTSAGGSQYRIIFGSQLGNNIDSGLVIPSGGSLNICYHDYTAHGDTNYCSTNNPLILNQWQYVALSFKNNDINIYHNGINIKNIGVGKTNTSNYALIGGPGADSYSGARYFNGLIDEVKIYNSALTADEIKQDFNQGSAISFGATNQTIGGTTTSLEYCIPGDTSYCASPVAEWKMDEKTGTTTKDTSGNNNNGTISGATWTSGKIGAGLNFNGSSQYVDFNPDILDSSCTGTVSLWIKRGPWNESYNTILTKSDGASWNDNHIQISRDSTTNNINMTISDNSSSTTNNVTTGTINENTWYYLTMVWNGSVLIGYINGQEVDRYNTSICVANDSTRFSIGRGAVGTNRFFNGKIDQVKIYNYARTPAQIAYDYNKGAPVGWWKLDDCQGLTAFDSSGLGNTGAISIGPSGTQTSTGTCNTSGTAWGNGVNGKYNSSLNFGGFDDYIDAGTNSLLVGNTGDISLAAWIKVPSSTSDGGIIGTRSNRNDYTQPYGFQMVGNSVYFRVGKSTTSIDITTPNVVDNKWHSIIGTIKGNNMVLYLDGKQINQTVFSGTRQVGYKLTIGSWQEGTSYPGYFFNGQIDDIRIYNYALTSEQIKTVYNNGAVNFQ